MIAQKTQKCPPNYKRETLDDGNKQSALWGSERADHEKTDEKKIANGKCTEQGSLNLINVKKKKKDPQSTAFN